MQVLVWGSFRVIAADGTDRTPRGKKTRALLAYLALARTFTASRGQLAALLWSTRSTDHARASLRQSLRELKTALGRDAHDVLRAGRERVALNLDPGDVDVSAVHSQGALLADLDDCDEAWDDWLVTERAVRCARLMTDLHARLAEATEDSDDVVAIELANRILSVDASDEIAHRAIMQRHVQRGAFGAALQQEQACVDVLRRRFAVEPTKETRELGDAIRRRRYALPLATVPK